VVWATQVKPTLRPFLAPLFAALHRPSQKLQCVGLQQIEEMVQLLGKKWCSWLVQGLVMRKLVGACQV
jgi:hypothetical protein